VRTLEERGGPVEKSELVEVECVPIPFGRRHRKISISKWEQSTRETSIGEPKHKMGRKESRLPEVFENRRYNSGGVHPRNKRNRAGVWDTAQAARGELEESSFRYVTEFKQGKKFQAQPGSGVSDGEGGKSTNHPGRTVEKCRRGALKGKEKGERGHVGQGRSREKVGGSVRWKPWTLKITLSGIVHCLGINL